MQDRRKHVSIIYLTERRGYETWSSNMTAKWANLDGTNAALLCAGVLSHSRSFQSSKCLGTPLPLAENPRAASCLPS